MRKEVRLGAAIGGGLVVLIVIYAIFSSKSHHDKSKNNQVVLDTGKTGSAADNSGGTDRSAFSDPVIAADKEHGAAPAASHDPSTAVNVPPVPHGDDVPPPMAAADTTPSRHGANWVALLSEGAPVTSETPKPARSASDLPPSPSRSDAAGNGLVDVSDHAVQGQPSDPTPTGDSSAGPAGASTPATHDAAPITAARTHRIAAGETFSSIARSVYGDGKYYKAIMKANPTVDPSHLKPGTVILLPEKTQSPRPAAEAGADTTTGTAITATETHHHTATTGSAAIDPNTQYRVQSNDSLYRISMKLYHSPNKVDAIYQLNKEQIGSDPAKLKLNMVLKLPEPPAQSAAR